VKANTEQVKPGVTSFSPNRPLNHLYRTITEPRPCRSTHWALKTFYRLIFWPSSHYTSLHNIFS
jgi:hypothetical protein